jgi:hypothetical protein
VLVVCLFLALAGNPGGDFFDLFANELGWLTLFVQVAVLGRRLAGVIAYPLLARVKHPGIPRIYGWMLGVSAFAVLLVIRDFDLARMRPEYALTILSEVPFLAARANVLRLFRRLRGDIPSGADWRAARQGDLTGLAGLLVSGALVSSSLARHWAAALGAGLGAGIALAASLPWMMGRLRRPFVLAGQAATRRLGFPALRRLLLGAVVMSRRLTLGRLLIAGALGGLALGRVLLGDRNLDAITVHVPLLGGAAAAALLLAWRPACDEESDAARARRRDAVALFLTTLVGALAFGAVAAVASRIGHPPTGLAAAGMLLAAAVLARCVGVWCLRRVSRVPNGGR